MENYNEQKARDYDKEPIVIKDYAFYDYEIFHDCYAYRMLILHLGHYRSKSHWAQKF